MDDLARLGVDRRVVLGRLQVGEHIEPAPGELGPEEQGLVAGDQRVAAEDGHEPGHSGSRQPADPPASLHPQGREVGDRLEEGTAEVVPVGADLRHAQAPRRERLADARHLVAEAPLGLARHDVVAFERRDHVDA